MTLLPLTMENGWRPDLEMVRRAIRPNTRLMIVNTPHNPTGAHLSHAEWDALIGLAQEADAFLLGDEVYRLSEYDPADCLPAIADAYTKGISLGVMSKAFGLAGLRVGWLATRDHSILERASGLKDYTTICNSAPSEILAIIALRAKERILARTGGIIREKTLKLWQRLRKRQRGVPLDVHHHRSRRIQSHIALSDNDAPRSGANRQRDQALVTRKHWPWWVSASTG